MCFGMTLVIESKQCLQHRLSPLSFNVAGDGAPTNTVASNAVLSVCVQQWPLSLSLLSLS